MKSLYGEDGIDERGWERAMDDIDGWRDDTHPCPSCGVSVRPGHDVCQECYEEEMDRYAREQRDDGCGASSLKPGRNCTPTVSATAGPMADQLALVATGESAAVLSPCRRYRYELTRIWDPSKPVVTWVMLNPSTADDVDDDPTIRKCCGFARRWGYGGIRVVNLFALRSTDPKALRAADSVGPDNLMYLRGLAQENVIVAWGDGIRHAGPKADALINGLVRRFDGWGVCLGFTKRNRQPRHPLMLAYSTPRVPWPGEGR